MKLESKVLVIFGFFFGKKHLPICLIKPSDVAAVSDSHLTLIFYTKYLVKK